MEERALNAQLALSFTLTLTDEENIRQRLLEIRKTKLKRERVAEVVTALTEKFEKETDALGERNRAKEDEQKTLLTRNVYLEDIETLDAAQAFWLRSLKML